MSYLNDPKRALYLAEKYSCWEWYYDKYSKKKNSREFSTLKRIVERNTRLSKNDKILLLDCFDKLWSGVNIFTADNESEADQFILAFSKITPENRVELFCTVSPYTDLEENVVSDRNKRMVKTNIKNLNPDNPQYRRNLAKLLDEQQKFGIPVSNELKSFKVKRNNVLRITIDEQLSEDLIQLMIAEIKTSNESKCDLLGDLWNDEEVNYMDTNDWASFLSEYYLKKCPFKDLKEGQVFIYGPVSIISKGKSPMLKIEGNNKLIPITEYIKQDTKDLYNKALLGLETGRKEEIK